MLERTRKEATDQRDDHDPHKPERQPVAPARRVPGPRGHHCDREDSNVESDPGELGIGTPGIVRPHGREQREHAERRYEPSGHESGNGHPCERPKAEPERQDQDPPERDCKRVACGFAKPAVVVGDQDDDDRDYDRNRIRARESDQSRRRAGSGGDLVQLGPHPS